MMKNQIHFNMSAYVKRNWVGNTNLNVYVSTSCNYIGRQFTRML